MTRAVVAFGSNIDPATHVPKGLDLLHERAHIQAASRFVVTRPIGRPEQPDYWNGAVAVTVPPGIDEATFRAALRDIEAACDRARSRDRYAERTLDLDLTLWDGRIVDDDVLRRSFIAAAVLQVVDVAEVPAPHRTEVEERAAKADHPAAPYQWSP